MLQCLPPHCHALQFGQSGILPGFLIRGVAFSFLSHALQGLPGELSMQTSCGSGHSTQCRQYLTPEKIMQQADAANVLDFQLTQLSSVHAGKQNLSHT